MLLYTPTITEIEHYSRRLAAKWPQLADRAQRARVLLGFPDEYNEQRLRLLWTGAEWECLSSQRENFAYSLETGCECPDYRQERAPVIAHRRMCKHRIALAIYRKICLDHLLARTLHHSDGHAIRQAKAEPARWIVRDNLVFYQHMPNSPLLLCRLKSTYNGWHIDDEQLAKAGAWLHTAQSVAPIDIVPVTQPLPPQPDWQSDEEYAAMMDATILPYREWQELHGDKLSRYYSIQN